MGLDLGLNNLNESKATYQSKFRFIRSKVDCFESIISRLEIELLIDFSNLFQSEDDTATPVKSLGENML